MVSQKTCRGLSLNSRGRGTGAGFHREPEPELEKPLDSRTSCLSGALQFLGSGSFLLPLYSWAIILYWPDFPMCGLGPKIATPAFLSPWECRIVSHLTSLEAPVLRSRERHSSMALLSSVCGAGPMSPGQGRTALVRCHGFIHFKDKELIPTSPQIIFSILIQAMFQNVRKVMDSGTALKALLIFSFLLF